MPPRPPLSTARALRFAAALVALAALAALGAPRAEAAPMWTPLATLRAEATTIVLGTVSPDLVVHVDAVVRGTSMLGPRKVKPSPDGHTSVSGRALVALDKDDRLRWAGALVAGRDLETGVIHLHGFFDWNAHVVSPGVLTLDQLRSFLATGAFTQRFAVTIVAHDGTGAFVPAGPRFTIDHDPIARTSAARGAGNKCFDALSLTGLDWGSGDIHLASSCPNDQRRLRFATKLTGVDASGAITMEAWPASPYLDAQDFAVWWKDSSVVTVKRLLDVRLDDGVTWTWDVGTGLIDPRGTPRAHGSMSTGSGMANGVQTTTVVYEFTGAKITFRDPSSGAITSGGDGTTLVQMADTRSWGTCTFEEDGRPPRTCSLHRGRSRFVRR